MSKELARGRVGLNNLGNTCFMNAATQFLLHAPEFVIPFLDSDDNPIEGQTNNKYKMVREFAKLARTHYSNQVKTQNPQPFRKSIKNIASYLCDGDQHDSHELMNFVLQGLEEELNRHTDQEVHMENNFIPDYTMDPQDMEDIIQEEIFQKAKEWWRCYKELNDCFITDELYGEICNQIQCPRCKKCTYNYSSFNTLYVPVKKNSATINILLIVQQYLIDSREYNFQYFTIPVSVKMSDHLKMLDMRLQERFSFSYANALFTEHEAIDPAIFEDAKILYLSKTVNKDGTMTFNRLTLDRTLTEIVSNKNTTIVAYLIPPQQKGSIPIFMNLSVANAIKSNDNTSINPLENRKLNPLLVTFPILFTLPKTAPISSLTTAIDDFIDGCEQGRVYTNLHDSRPSTQYATSAYSTIPITVDYFYHSPLFPTARSQSLEKEEEEIEKEKRGKQEKENEHENEHENENDGENEKDEQFDTVGEEVAEKVVVTFPRMYTGSLASFNKLITHLSTYTDITGDALSSSSSSMTMKEKMKTTTLMDLFTEVDNKTEYRAVMVFTGVSGQTTDLHQNYHHGEETTRRKLMNCMRDKLYCVVEASTLKEEDGSGPSNGLNSAMMSRAWGKGKKSAMTAGNGNGAILKLADCIELKKTTTVLLGNKSTCQHCHQSTTVETTPFLARLPPILIIQLKRFKYSMDTSSSIGRGRSARNQSFGKQKIDAYIDCPLGDLDMTEFCLPFLQASTASNPLAMHYELIGVINHSGTADFGHYYAYCKDGYNGGDNWFEYNDSSVSAVKEEDVISKNAYVLMYRRCDLGKSIYSTISTMNIQVAGGKKGETSEKEIAEVMMKVEKEKKEKEKKEMKEMKLERNRSEGVDNERKDGRESSEMEQPANKKRMSIAERKALKKKQKETERAEKRK